MGAERPPTLDEVWARVPAEVAEARFGRARAPLGQLVAQVSEGYTRERGDLRRASTGRDAMHARLRFFLPRDLAKVALPLHELDAAGLLPARRWRVLDLGAGLGTTSLGAAWYASRRETPPEQIAVDAVERDAAALGAFEALAARHGELGLPAMTLRTRVGDLKKGVRERGPYDLILLGLVLNELPFAERRGLLEGLAAKLAPGGSLIVLEPALREVTRELHRLRDELLEAGALSVFAPCPHAAPCPMRATKKDWCHEDVPFRLPDPLAEVARAAGLRFERLTFAYLTLRRDDARRAAGDEWRVVSQPLKTKGKLELWLCGGAGERRKLMRLDRKASEANAAFGEARRGDLLRLGSDSKRVGPNDAVERRHPRLAGPRTGE